MFPFHIPIYVPLPLVNWVRRSAVKLRIIPAAPVVAVIDGNGGAGGSGGGNVPDSSYRKVVGKFAVFSFPVNFITAPLIADLFLLAISAIGRKEVHDGTIGAEGIKPLDIMIFFITLAYIAISIDASGLIRYLAFKVLQWGGEVGHRLFFYLYAFFFLLASFVGNDPIILSGTAFLAYMTRVSENIASPRAWIYTQFAVANIASAILVSSNPTNLVLAGAFSIRFIDYTANMVVPVVVTGVVLFPFLLCVLFADERAIPTSIKMHQLPEEARREAPVNPNIPHVRQQAENLGEAEQGGQAMALSLEEIMHPFLDKKSAAFGGIIMAATLVTVLALNAASQGTGHHDVFWVTLPAAFVMLCWDLAYGWLHRKETRETVKAYKEKAEGVAVAQILQEEEQQRQEQGHGPETSSNNNPSTTEKGSNGGGGNSPEAAARDSGDQSPTSGAMHQGTDANPPAPTHLTTPIPDLVISSTTNNSPVLLSTDSPLTPVGPSAPMSSSSTKVDGLASLPDPGMNLEKMMPSASAAELPQEPASLVSVAREAYEWLQVTFPTVMTVMSHLPFALIPFAFSMFVLVQALVGTGWVNVFAYGWYHWSKRTGTVGSIGGMGFLSVIPCNVSNTPLGAYCIKL